MKIGEAAKSKGFENFLVTHPLKPRLDRTCRSLMANMWHSTKFFRHARTYKRNTIQRRFQKRNFHEDFILSNIETNSSSVANISKRFQCMHCDYSAQWLSHLKMHEVVHTGERRFRCSICGKGFTQKHVLKYHLTTHRNRN